MRIVILINPKLPVEHGIKGRKYAEASIGFNASMDSTEDTVSLARGLRELIEVLEAKRLSANEQSK